MTPFAAPIVSATLVRRYQRFLADVRLEDGRLVTAHCPNTGSLRDLQGPGRAALLSDRGARAGRRLRFTLEAVRAGRTWVCVNTARANQLAAEAVLAGCIPELSCRRLRREVAISEHTRIDLVLEGAGRRGDVFVEVKSVTLRVGHGALFPDAVTARGRRHLAELERLAARDRRAVQLFLVMRADCNWVGPADAIDPEYGQALRRAAERGVEILAYAVGVTRRGLRVLRHLPISLGR